MTPTRRNRVETYRDDLGRYTVHIVREMRDRDSDTWRRIASVRLMGCELSRLVADLAVASAGIAEARWQERKAEADRKVAAE